jgi:hypothetical protein
VTNPAYVASGPTIYLRRETNLLTDDQVAKIAAACNKQVVQDLAPAWITLPRPVTVAALHQPLPSDAQVVRLVDASDVKDALGYHTEDSGDIVYAIVGVGTVLQAGSKVLTGALSVSTVISHEVCEMVCNPNVSGWSDSGRGWLVATEVCDPVQSSFYTIDGVAVSNFVTPDFFSPIVSRGDKFDHQGVLKKPFQIAKGGYVLNYEGGKINTYFGEVPPPDWVMKMKGLPTARTTRLREHRPG